MSAFRFGASYDIIHSQGKLVFLPPKYFYQRQMEQEKQRHWVLLL